MRITGLAPRVSVAFSDRSVASHQGWKESFVLEELVVDDLSRGTSPTPRTASLTHRVDRHDTPTTVFRVGGGPDPVGEIGV